jgi:hypothetical protein
VLLNHRRRGEQQIGACTAIGFLWIYMDYYVTLMISIWKDYLFKASMRPILLLDLLCSLSYRT